MSGSSCMEAIVWSDESNISISLEISDVGDTKVWDSSRLARDTTQERRECWSQQCKKEWEIWVILDIVHEVTEFSVCPANFLSFLGPHYAPFLPFGK